MPTVSESTKVKRTRRTQLELLQDAESSGGRVKKIKFHIEEPDYDSDGSEIPLLQGKYGAPQRLTPAEFLALPPGAVGPNDGVFYGSDEDLFVGPNGTSPDSSYNNDETSDDDEDDNLEDGFFEDEKSNGWWTHLDQNGNKLLWFPELAQKISHNAVCCKCAEKQVVSNLNVSQFTCGIATQVNFECETDETHNFLVDPDTHSSMGQGDRAEPSLYTNNVMAYLLAMSLGVGLEGLSRILGYLSLRPHVGNYSSWGGLQEGVGSILGRFADAVVEHNIRHEVRATVEDRNSNEEADDEESLDGSFDLCEDDDGGDLNDSDDFSVIENECATGDVIVLDDDDKDEDEDDDEDADDKDDDDDDDSNGDDDDNMGDGDNDKEEKEDDGGNDSNNDDTDPRDDGGNDGGGGGNYNADGSDEYNDEYDAAGAVGITISCDAGWQKRAAGCSYSSMSGHLLLWGGRLGWWLEEWCTP